MKNLFTILIATLFCVSGLFAQDGDKAYVAEWAAMPSWWPKPSAEAPVRAQATAVEVTEFDAQNCDFDTEWAKIPGNGYAIAHQFGLNASHTGVNDFKDGAFKVFADANNMYIMLIYTDEEVTGNETVEIAWAPYLMVNTDRVVDGVEGQWYTRFSELGSYKATFKNTGFDAAMIVSGPTANINWGGTNEILTNNLFVDNHTEVGSSTVKIIYTIGYPALTGEGRPDFNLDIWNTLNEGAGISFDLKVNDVDTDDALNTDDPPVKKPAEYWWNTSTNDCWALTYYAGFLNVQRIQVSGDETYVADWTGSMPSWWPKPAAEEPVRTQASAVPMAETFDAVNCDFDTEWAKLTNSYPIAHQLGLNASHTGPNDFKDASYKVVCDDAAMYILLKYTDDDVTGDESAEIAWAPYLKLNVPDVPDLEGQWYTRYVEFGAYKATFKSTGLDAAMMVTGATYNINWGGTNEVLSTSLYVDDHSETGSSTVKQIITISYSALTGDARPEFDQTIWKALNDGKGISFDLKVNDVDSDDALNTDDPPVKKPAEYWWNTSTNDCWAITYYAGFLNVANATAVAPVKAGVSIFEMVTPDQIRFSNNANVAVYNTVGQLITRKSNIREMGLSNLPKGVYIIRANDESRKVVRF